MEARDFIGEAVELDQLMMTSRHEAEVEVVINEGQNQQELRLRSINPEVSRLIDSYLSKVLPQIRRNSSPLTRQFLLATYLLLKKPFIDLDKLPIDMRVKEKLQALQSIPLEGENRVMNIFSLLTQENVSKEHKDHWLEAQLSSRFEWIEYQDVLDLMKKLAEEELRFKPSEEPDEYSPHRIKNPERLDQPKNCLAIVTPFWGGYYKDGVYEVWNGEELKWKKSERLYKHIGDYQIDENRKRTYVSSALTGKMHLIKLPYGWGIDQKSINWLQESPDDFKFLQDQNGQIYLYIQSEKDRKNFPYSISIGFINQVISPLPHEAEEINNLLPGPLVNMVNGVMTENIPAIGKARKIANFIRNHLQYDDSYFYENIYKANLKDYFFKIWVHKKAKCDEANTLAAVTLRKFGFKVNYISGHFTKSSRNNSALLHDGNRHGWIEVYDDLVSRWVRLDATPKGDPNLDDLDQELVEGDFGEDEAEMISDEELTRLIAQLEAVEADDHYDQLELSFAEEADCSAEEAAEILGKIKKLRKLRDDRGRVVYEEAKKIWQKAMIKNLRQREIYYSPVRMSEGEELSDPSLAMIDLVSLSNNPSGFEHRDLEQIKERYFGGFDVYILADLSGSMTQIDSHCGLKKNEAQRDSVFLFVDSLMASAALSRANKDNLQNLMPIKVCVITFGPKTQVVFPLCDQWGPAQQIKLYRSLNVMPGGSTPDHEALNMTILQIKDSKLHEERQRKKLETMGRKLGRTNRFVAVFADGGSDIKTEVRRLVQSLRKEGIVVWGFGITGSSREMIAAYQPDVEIIAKASDVAARGLNRLIETVRKWYDIN